MSLPICRWRSGNMCHSRRFVGTPREIPRGFCGTACHCADHDPELAISPLIQLAPPTPRSVCDHLGRPATPEERAGLPARDWRHCEKGHGIVCPCNCGKCPDHSEKQPWANTLVAKFDAANMPGTTEYRMNMAMIDDGEGFMVAWKDHRIGSRIRMCRLDSKFKPIPESYVELALKHPSGASGREDPRFFRFQGKLHVAYTGVIRKNGATHTNVLYARLGPWGDVEEEFEPVFSGRAKWEKNWGFFESNGELYSVYYSHPRHRILRIEKNRSAIAYDTPNLLPWGSAEIRGGASPVLHQGEFWHWFHSRGNGSPGLHYDMGLIKFEAFAPFRITYQSPHPVYRADLTTHRPRDFGVPVWFPCGAVPRGHRWLISAGVHERWSEIREFQVS